MSIEKYAEDRGPPAVCYVHRKPWVVGYSPGGGSTTESKHTSNHTRLQMTSSMSILFSFFIRPFSFLNWLYKGFPLQHREHIRH